jgi:SpoVK/Ycf46/Vps4 family AAA+-type ATPase
MTGFYLSSRNNLIVQEEKIYGEGPRKVDKVLRAFEVADRNFGVILSGRKGIGKSLFARLLATRAVDYSLPLIIVSDYFPGIASFLSSIEQEVIVLFDEFDKTFASSDDVNPQEELLPLFDGLDGGKKLFIVTCNEVHKLNSYLLNRPGRFHYHFILNNPSSEDIREYMTDKLKLEYHNVIDRVIAFSMTADITYDILRAIAFELNNGYSFEETIADLNISKEGAPSFMVSVTLNNGETRTAIFNNVDLSDDDNEGQWFYNKNQKKSQRWISCLLQGL